MTQIRQPIVTFAGHVDHGKTSLLDSIRGTTVAKKEAGGITQKISFTCCQSEFIKAKCHELLDKYHIKLEIPGFLFIDTPGHAAFTNLRKRGGSLADLAILVVDLNEGMMPQTLECIEILKAGKVPFIVAVNKIDAIHGWKNHADEIEKNLSMQAEYVRKDFDFKFYNLVAALSAHGFNADLFSRVPDFTKQLALVPCSAKTGEGIPELLVMLCGLSQKFLSQKLQIGKEGKGTILEVKKDKGMTHLEAVLDDGVLRQGDEIAIASFHDPLKSKVRSIFEALPLNKGYEPVKEVTAAAGVRIQMTETENILSGMPFAVITPQNEKEVMHSLKKEVSETIQLDAEGIVIKAESLGSLEALLFLLRKEGIPVNKASIGTINKVDIVNAISNLEQSPLYGVILGFNVLAEDDAKDERVKVITQDIVYRLIEDLKLWQQEKQAELMRDSLSHLTLPCKIKVLRFVFRQSKPAIFGVHVEAGTLKTGIEMMNDKGEKIDTVKGIQAENKAVDKIGKGKDVAVSMPNITHGRQIKENDVLYSNLNEEEFLTLKKHKQYLKPEELSIMQEIARIKRQSKATWGI